MEAAEFSLLETICLDLMKHGYVEERQMMKRRFNTAIIRKLNEICLVLHLIMPTLLKWIVCMVKEI